MVRRKPPRSRSALLLELLELKCLSLRLFLILYDPLNGLERYDVPHAIFLLRSAATWWGFVSWYGGAVWAREPVVP